MRKKLAASLLVLAVLGIFAGLAVAQSGAVTAILRLNTGTNSLELDTAFRASEVNADILVLGGFALKSPASATLKLLPFGLQDSSNYLVLKYSSGANGKKVEFNLPSGGNLNFVFNGSVFAKDFCTDNGVCLSSIGSGNGTGGGTYWKPFTGGIYYDGGIVEVNSGSFYVESKNYSATLHVISSSSDSSVEIKGANASLRIYATNGTSKLTIEDGSQRSVELNTTGIYVEKPPKKYNYDWKCKGDICYSGPRGPATVPSAISDCTREGAHLCSLAEYGHFVDELHTEKYWASDMADSLVPPKPDYTMLKISKDHGNPKWDLANKNGESEAYKYYCCKYIGAVYNKG